MKLVQVGEGFWVSPGQVQALVEDYYPADNGTWTTRIYLRGRVDPLVVPRRAAVVAATLGRAADTRYIHPWA